MQHHPFAEYYKKLTSRELFNILLHAADYQTDAIDAANEEVTRRNISIEEREKIEQELESIASLKESARHKREAAREKIIRRGAGMLDSISPIQIDTNLEGQIRLFSLMYLLVLSYDLYAASTQIISMSRYYDFSISTFVRIALLPIFIMTALFFFWKRKTGGWVLMAIQAVLLSLGSLLSISLYFYNKSAVSGYGVFQYPIMGTLVSIIFFGASVYFLCLKGVRERFRIDDTTCYSVLGLSAAFTAFMFWIKT